MKTKLKRMPDGGSSFDGLGLLKNAIQSKGNSAPQGVSMDTYIEDKNKLFIDYIATNVQENLLKKSFKDFKTLPKAQYGEANTGDDPPTSAPGLWSKTKVGASLGPETMATYREGLSNYPVSMLPSNTSILPKAIPEKSDTDVKPNTPSSSNYYPLNWGNSNLNIFTPNPAIGQNTTTVGTPDYVRAYKANNNEFPTVAANNSFQEQGDYVTPNKPNAPQVKSKPSWGTLPSDLGMLGRMGVQALNAGFDRMNEKKRQNQIQNQLTVENTTPLSYGSKGDYDTNSGAFRPNQKTAMQFKKGGTYKGISVSEIDRLLKEGYEFDIID